MLKYLVYNCKRTLLKLISFLFVILFSIQSYADPQCEECSSNSSRLDSLGVGEVDEDCGKKSFHADGAVFELTVENYATANVYKFKYCRVLRKDASFFVITQVYRDDKPKKNIYKLTESQSETVLAKFDKALESNLKDRPSGLDGSKWCLASIIRLTVIDICFWSVAYKQEYEERGLSGMYYLGNYFWELAGFPGNIEDSITFQMPIINE